jgi:hypothetical protein
MLKKPIEYLDFNDELQKEDFYFNLTLAEIAEMELSYEGGLSGHLQRIINDKDGAAIIATFKHLLAKSYGVRSDDDKRFMKTPELWEEFSQTNAYDVLFIQLVTDAGYSAEFVKGIVPKSIAETMGSTENTPAQAVIAAIDRAEQSTSTMLSPTLSVQAKVTKIKSLDDYTDLELLTMTDAQFSALFGNDASKMSKHHLELAFRRRFNIK